MDKILIILGPTATGKTDLALQLAKQFHGELVACDSRQVYVGLDVGTGKLPSRKNVTLRPASRQGGLRSGNILAEPVEAIRKGNGYWIVNGVKIWMYDVVDLATQYTVADYVKDAGKVIDKIVKRGKLPIIVGGTGLYLKALLEGIPNLSIPVDRKLRGQLQKLSLEELQEKLEKLSPTKWKGLNESDRQNSRRLIRSIELETSPRRSPYGHLRGVTNFNVLKIGLSASREILYKRSDLRVLSWFTDGIIEEVKRLHQEGVNWDRFKSLGLEYGVIAEYLEGDQTSEIELVGTIKNKLHGYIRRQLTWFQKEKRVCWFDITDKNYGDRIEKAVCKWYD